MKPGVTVVIGAHDAEKFLAATLTSIAKQTLPPARIVVVDDGSTDETAAIAESFGAHVIRQGKSGVAGARNSAIPLVDTEFAAFCDADDLWEPTKLERQIGALVAEPDCDFAFCDYYDFTSEGVRHASILKEVLTHFQPSAFEPLGAGTYRCARARINALTLQQSFVLPSTFAMRTTLLQRLAAFRTDVGTEEDVEFLLRVFTQTDALYVDEPLMGYRRHTANVTADPRRQRVGAIRLAAHVIARPEAYRPESSEFYRASFSTYLFKAGRMYASLGDVAMGRWFLRRSFEFDRRLRTAVWIAIAPAFHVPALRSAARAARGA